MSAALQTERRPSSVDDVGIAVARGPRTDTVAAPKLPAAGGPQPAPAAVAACPKAQADLGAIEEFVAKLMTRLQAKSSGAVLDGAHPQGAGAMSLRIVQLHLLEVHYGGQSIGDDIVITLEVAGRHHEIRRSLRPGAVTPLRQELLQVIEERDAPSFSLALRVVEEDPLFNDVGTSRVELCLDPNQTTQRFTADVAVGEAGSLFGRGDVANFRFVFEFRVTRADQYVIGDPNGWLRVRLANKQLVSLPESLHVRLDKLDRDREYFKIMEGPHRGLSASVAKKRDGSSWLSADDVHIDAVKLHYSISKKTLTIAGLGSFAAEDDQTELLSVGICDLEIPDAPHAAGEGYLDRAPHAKTWFRIGHSEGRFLHPGTHSHGCISILEIDRWKDIYAILIRARKGDGISVGILSVTE